MVKFTIFIAENWKENYLVGLEYQHILFFPPIYKLCLREVGYFIFPANLQIVSEGSGLFYFFRQFKNVSEGSGLFYFSRQFTNCV